MNKSDCIVFDNVSISYGAEQAVRDVSFSVHTGEVFSIVGESGSGKSTLIRAAFGMLKKATISGQILLNGTDITTLSDKDWRQMRGMQVSMIFQNPGAYLNPARTVENHFKDLLRAHDEPYDVNCVLHMLQLVHLTEGNRILQSYPFQLSGGMQQRLAIALSLILKPDIVFADEPTSALDMLVQSSVLDLLKEVTQALGATVILVIHNIKAAACIANRIGVMNKGRLVEMGATEEVMAHPKDDYTRILLDSVMKVV
ncbi:ABC transporter ATP-binding protein [Veillonella sp. AS16]|uniref:ABC transporter ATP-binding protein n=1 Tax=Veillonella sp. AS16 TaxID=936589 RepID=UPI0003E1EA5D|nr:ABC transporter ATP-binding protein [Veillonella sp. AS16]ETS92639.1 dipeptide ABC transporter, ATP-binding protein DppD family protein [Veillonella sp. AS16]